MRNDKTVLGRFHAGLKKTNMLASRYLKNNRVSKALNLYKGYTSSFCFDEDDIKASTIIADAYERMHAEPVEIKRLRTLSRLGHSDFCFAEDINHLSEKELVELFYSYGKYVESALILFALSINGKNIFDEIPLTIRNNKAISIILRYLNNCKEKRIYVCIDNCIKITELDRIKAILSFIDIDVYYLLFDYEETQIDDFSSLLNKLKSIPATLICSSVLSELFCEHPSLLSRVTRVAYDYELIPENALTCLSVCDYSESMKRKYGYDLEHCLSMKTECAFSIVLPIRNTPDYLVRTIETCLKQYGEIDFEVLVSDNSSENNHAVREELNKVNDSRVRYIHSPIELDLTKSFEFAVVNAKGRYILPIGADDGLCPDTLLKLQNYFSIHDRDFVVFERGFFYWKKPKCVFVFDKTKINGSVEKIKSEDLFREIIYNYRSSFMDLPLMYLNTCFKKDYLKEVLHKTGKLYYGYSQDVYFGVLNLFLCKEFDKINEILVICGTSENSFGLKSNRTVHNENELMKKRARHVDYVLDQDFDAGYTSILHYPPYLTDKALLISEYYKIKYLGIQTDFKYNMDAFSTFLFAEIKSLPVAMSNRRFYEKLVYDICVATDIRFYEHYLKYRNRWRLQSCGAMVKSTVKRIIYSIFVNLHLSKNAITMDSIEEAGESITKLRTQYCIQKKLG